MSRPTLTPSPSIPFTAAGRSMLPSPCGRRDGDEGLQCLALTPNPSPARAGEGSVQRAARVEGMEGNFVRASGAELSWEAA